MDRNSITEQFSKKAGAYLLKGYTLLGDLCPACQSPLLRNRHEDKIFCIYCNEIKMEQQNKTPQTTSKSNDENDEAWKNNVKKNLRDTAIEYSKKLEHSSLDLNVLFSKIDFIVSLVDLLEKVVNIIISNNDNDKSWRSIVNKHLQKVAIQISERMKQIVKLTPNLSLYEMGPLKIYSDTLKKIMNIINLIE